MPIDTTPDSQDLWEGIGGHFDSLTQVLAEFVDNAAANFIGHATAFRQVFIGLEALGDNEVRVTVEDTGTGIQDLAIALRLGDRSAQDSPLSAHGFGVKHALATANPGNDNWYIATRTSQELAGGTFRAVSAPYSFSIDVSLEPTEAWPGTHHGSGTFIRFVCSRKLFDSIAKGIPGTAGFSRVVDYLIEDLGYTYADLISGGQMQITTTAGGAARPVAAVLPLWVDSYNPGRGHVERSFRALNGGRIRMEYEFGEIRDGESVRYYRRNVRSSGVEIRLNGRAIERGLFSEIWPREKHPDYNHFLVRLNLVADSKDALPKTRSSKNGFREGDPILDEVFEWIRTQMPEPPRELTSSIREADLTNELKEKMEAYLTAPDKVVSTEQRVYTSTGNPPRVDLYVYDGSELWVYEAKKDVADVQALYQLMMYWDGLVEDGITPSRGVLIASSFSSGVPDVIAKFNARKDAAGSQYRFETSTWRDKHVGYPPD